MDHSPLYNAFVKALIPWVPELVAGAVGLVLLGMSWLGLRLMVKRNALRFALEAEKKFGDGNGAEKRKHAHEQLVLTLSGRLTTEDNRLAAIDKAAESVPPPPKGVL
jgi:hypothetical protein